MSKIIETSTIIPSVVGIGDINLGLLSAGKLRRGTQETPHVIVWNGTQFLVGTGVEQFTRPHERMDMDRLGEGQDAQALTRVALAELTDPARQMTASIVVGFPVHVMQDKALASQILRKLRSWLAGEQRFTLDGADYQILIESVQAMAQPAGAFFAWGLNNAGKWARPAADLDALVVICDNGFNTVDKFAVQGGNVVGKFTGGETAGIRRAAEALIHEVKTKYGVDLTRHEADQYLRAGKPVLSCWQGEVDLLPLTQQALESAAAQVGDLLETSWGNGKQFRYLLFTGGGSELLKQHLLRRYPHGVVLSNPVLANALGLARYGRRIFKSSRTVIGLDPGFGGFKAVALTLDA